jgi:hypothetical protein
VRAVAAPLPGLGIPALSRPAPVVAFFPRIDTGGLAARAWKGVAGPGRVLDQDSGAAAAVAPCPVLGCVVAVAGIAEVPWEAPWRPFPLAGNLFEECGIMGPPLSGLVCMLLSVSWVRR